MKKILVFSISLVFLMAGSALAERPDNPSGIANIVNQLADETQARIDGDAALQTQIDSLKSLKVYDADGNFLGNYVGDIPDPYNVDIYIPSLNAFARIILYDPDGYVDPGTFERHRYFFDADTEEIRYASKPLNLFSWGPCGEPPMTKYYISNETPLHPILTGIGYWWGQLPDINVCLSSSFFPAPPYPFFSVEEILPSEFPFPYPVTLPISYRYE